MVTLDGGLFSVLTRFVSTPSKEGIFYVGVSVAGTTKIGKWLEGDIAEVIAFDRLVTDEERYKIESYLAAKYGYYTDQVEFVESCKGIGDSQL